MSRRRVAVLGAGIMGCSVAIQLARRGFDVTVFDREPAPMAAASRWNEGKIHLGYIYGADPTLATAQHLLTGGLLFEDRLCELIDTDVPIECDYCPELATCAIRGFCCPRLACEYCTTELLILAAQWVPGTIRCRHHLSATKFCAKVSDFIESVEPL